MKQEQLIFFAVDSLSPQDMQTPYSFQSAAINAKELCGLTKEHSSLMPLQGIKERANLNRGTLDSRQQLRQQLLIQQQKTFILGCTRRHQDQTGKNRRVLVNVQCFQLAIHVHA